MSAARCPRCQGPMPSEGKPCPRCAVSAPPAPPVTQCPVCQYVRGPDDPARREECPRCGAVYQKVLAREAQFKQGVTEKRTRRLRPDQGQKRPDGSPALLVILASILIFSLFVAVGFWSQVSGFLLASSVQWRVYTNPKELARGFSLDMPCEPYNLGVFLFDALSRPLIETVSPNIGCEQMDFRVEITYLKLSKNVEFNVQAALQKRAEEFMKDAFFANRVNGLEVRETRVDGLPAQAADVAIIRNGERRLQGLAIPYQQEAWMIVIEHVDDEHRGQMARRILSSIKIE